MRVVALADSAEHVCYRYRVAAYRGALTAAGHSLEFHPLPQYTLGRLAVGRGLDADAVVLQRKLLPRWSVALLRRRVRKLVFDFDDAVWLRDSYSRRGFNDPKLLHRFRATVEACDLVVAGNEFLADEARRYVPRDRVAVIPTCLDTGKYQLGELPPRDGLQLVWIGSSSTLRGLERFAPTLSEIGRAVPGTRLKLICDRFITIPDLPVDACRWRGDTEAEEIASADVGIGWVPDDPWSRGKCGLKILQYHAAGLPVIANPVGVQVDIVRNGETGFLAATAAEWIGAAARLAADPGLRLALGRAGRRQVDERYSLAAGARAWLALLDRLRGGALKRTG